LGGVGLGLPTLNSFLVFLGLPQGSLIVHSFCTIASRFCVARGDKLDESGFSET
jgi:hypothetical protein